MMETVAPIGIPSEYVYFSRKSLRAPLLCVNPTYERVFDHLSWQRFISYEEVLSYWGISAEEARVSAEKTNETILFETLQEDKFLRTVFEANKELIVHRSQEQYDALKAYLSQIEMQGKAVIVDIGWHGSMQHALETFIEKCGIDAQLFGLYVGIGTPKKLKGSAKGFLYNGETDPRRSRILCFFGVVEKLFQCFEGSTSGYKITGDEVSPIKENFEFAAGDTVVEYISQIQESAVEYVKTGDRGNSDAFLDFGQNPSSKWLRIFSPFYNLDGGVKLFLLPQKRLMAYGLKEFIYALNQSSWKTGFMKKAFKLPLPYFYLYKILKK
ncbi:MAG: hypothetical protein MR215_04155 [Bacteroidales bacterium]|nr:hypothetical protein [Bacteroidales bacterium]